MPKQKQSAPESREFVSVVGAARILGVAKPTVKALIASGDLDAADISAPGSVRRTLRIPLESVRTLHQRRAAKRLNEVRRRSRPGPGPKPFIA